MQQLSSGLRAQFGRALHRPPGPPGGAPSTSNRSIHIPAWIPRPPAPRSTTSAAETFIKQARTFLTRVVGDLTAPGAFNLSTHASHTSGPSYSANPFRLQTIQQRLNGPTRVTLSRPLGAPFMPRAPAMPRNVTHVGLGTARNFSSARPLFQNIVENVPIAGRAFWEADWDIKLQKERELQKPKKYSPAKENARPSTSRVEPTRISAVVVAAPTEEQAIHAELDHYFPAPAVADVTTVLLIPIAPTPTSRLPLPTNPSVHTSNHPLIPFSYLASVHADHATHALRVSSLFARLDAAKVFDHPEVSCSAFGHASGLCTVLEVKFNGWTESRVRAVLGEAGTGWCVLEEIHEDEDNAALEDALSEVSFDTHVSSPSRAEIDPSASFVLPTLDFSASFHTETESWARAAPAVSDLEFHNEWTSAMDVGSDSGSDGDAFEDGADSFSLASGSGWSSPSFSSRSSPGSTTESNGWTPLGFSSTFADRIDVESLESVSDVDEPREYMF
ncbi:hypothetical protein BDW22DRAFT_1405895 [Trametopsis cervina]|nr:hypothetical protein BDW22DRAFT_1405895 [Trametopsis cervina]